MVSLIIENVMSTVLVYVCGKHIAAICLTQISVLLKFHLQLYARYVYFINYTIIDITNTKWYALTSRTFFLIYRHCKSIVFFFRVGGDDVAQPGPNWPEIE